MRNYLQGPLTLRGAAEADLQLEEAAGDGGEGDPDLIAESIHNRYSLGPSIRPIGLLQRRI